MIRRTGPGGTLPRVRTAPEPNVIQAPDVMRQLQQRLGVRGAHFTPTLEPTVQPVVVVEDIRNTSPILQIPYAAWARVIPDGISQAMVPIFNLAGSNRRMRIQKVFIDPVDPVEQVLNIATGLPSGASSPQAIKIGVPMHVSQFLPDIRPPDVRNLSQQQAAGRLLPCVSPPGGLATFFEQRVHGHAVGFDHRQVFVWEPAECWIYPNSAITLYYDFVDAMFDVSVQWYEEMLL